MENSPQSARLLRKRQIRFRFRKLVFNLVICRQWLQEIAQHETRITADAQANITKIIRRQVVKSMLSPQEKKSLNVPAIKRTAAQRRALLELFLSMKCLDTFSPMIRAQLSTVVQYRALAESQVIYQSGRLGYAMYILLDGDVALTKDRWVPVTGAWEKVQFHKVVAGNQFGHDALVNDTPRTHSAQTLRKCELFLIYKDDFERILLADTRHKWHFIQSSLLRFPYFGFWNDEQRILCCTLSRLIGFEPQQMVYSDVDAAKYYQNEAYFVLDGECELYQILTDNRGMKKFVRIGVFHRGAVFNLGERARDRFIVAKTLVQCLLIPQFWLLQNEQDVGNVWEKKMHDIDASIPTKMGILRQLKQEAAWTAWKNNQLNELYARSPLIAAKDDEELPVMLKIQLKNLK